MLKEILWITILAILFSCNASSNQTDQAKSLEGVVQTPTTLEKKANEFYQKEQYSKAKLYYDTLITIDSTKGVYYFRRAYCKSNLSSDDPSVVADYLKAIDHHYEKQQSAYLNIGIEHRFRAIFRCFTGQAKKAEYDTALYFYNECLKIEPNNAKALQEKHEVIKNREALK